MAEDEHNLEKLLSKQAIMSKQAIIENNYLEKIAEM